MPVPSLLLQRFTTSILFCCLSPHPQPNGPTQHAQCHTGPGMALGTTQHGRGSNCSEASAAWGRRSPGSATASVGEDGLDTGRRRQAQGGGGRAQVWRRRGTAGTEEDGTWRQRGTVSTHGGGGGGGGGSAVCVRVRLCGRGVGGALVLCACASTTTMRIMAYRAEQCPGRSGMTQGVGMPCLGRYSGLWAYMARTVKRIDCVKSNCAVPVGHLAMISEQYSAVVL